MYLEHFGFRELPFSLAPDPRFLFLSEQHREALAHLLFGVRTEGGFVLLTGEIGTGKTTVCRCFLEQLPPQTRAALVFNPSLAPGELLLAICDEFGILRPDGAGGAKAALDAINEFLLRIHGAGESAVLIVDEAQNLDADVLEQLRLLTNLETSRRKLLQIILMGQPELRATLARPDLRQLAQRITARFHLGPLSREEIGAYVRHRLEVAGCHEDLFPAPVARTLARLTRGVPRLVNILCDRALLGAFSQGKHQVDRAMLVQAAREIGGEHARAVVARRRLVALGAGAALVAAGLALALSGTRAPTTRPSPAAPSAAAPQAPVLPVSPVLPSRPATAAPAGAGAAAAGAAASNVAPAMRPGTSGVLRALLEQQEAATEREAWRGLYGLWGLGVREGDGGCAQALAHGLDCFRGDGGLSQLRRLNRPAIVRVADAQGAPRWLVLERLDQLLATFTAGGARTVVDVAKLGGYGISEFALLWRPPAGSRGVLAAGDAGPAVAWLGARLGGGAATGANARFDAAIGERVREFQRARSLAATGVAGPETLLLLDADPGPGTPTLAGQP